MKKTKFELVTGTAAYLIWYIYNDCHIKLKTLMNFDRNLELIISDRGDVFAYRYDHPEEMVHMVLDDGKWKFTKEGDELSKADQFRLKLLHREFTSN